MEAYNRTISSHDSKLLEKAKFTSTHMATLQESSLFNSINKLSTISKMFEFSEQQKTSLDLASKLYGLQAIDSIANLKNSPLSGNFKYHGDSVEENTPYFDQDNIHDIDEDINNELSGTEDFELLPSSVQSKIFYYLKFAFLTICLNIMSNYIYDQRQLLAQSLSELMNITEVKSYVRKSHSMYEKDILKGFRVVAGNNVNLRTNPSMKSDIILRLNTGTLLEVLDKSNRTWLFVEIEDGDEVVQGWISRKYAVYFK
jgi:hypothetical protein